MHETASRNKKIGHVVGSQWRHSHHMQQKCENIYFLSSVFPCFPCVSLIMSSFSVCFWICVMSCYVWGNWRKGSTTKWFELSCVSRNSLERTIRASISIRNYTKNFKLLTLSFSITEFTHTHTHMYTAPDNTQKQKRETRKKWTAKEMRKTRSTGESCKCCVTFLLAPMVSMLHYLLPSVAERTFFFFLVPGLAISTGFRVATFSCEIRRKPQLEPTTTDVTVPRARLLSSLCTAQSAPKCAWHVGCLDRDHPWRRPTRFTTGCVCPTRWWCWDSSLSSLTGSSCSWNPRHDAVLGRDVHAEDATVPWNAKRDAHETVSSGTNSIAAPSRPTAFWYEGYLWDLHFDLSILHPLLVIVLSDSLIELNLRRHKLLLSPTWPRYRWTHCRSSLEKRMKTAWSSHSEFLQNGVVWFFGVMLNTISMFSNFVLLLHFWIVLEILPEWKL